MIKIIMKRLILLGFILAVLIFVMPVFALSRNPIDLSTHQSQISSSLMKKLENPAPGETMTVIVHLREQADLKQVSGGTRSDRLQNTIFRLKMVAERSQTSIFDFLEQHQFSGDVDEIVPLWIFNGFSITATPRLISVIAAMPEVKHIYLDKVDITPSRLSTSITVEPNIDLINAPEVWLEGWQGDAVVVASMDTGVDVLHPALSVRWRGGNNSWFDPYGEHNYPTDFSTGKSGHGTQTMGVMLGGDESGSALGVAPGAKWIAVKIFNDSGNATATEIHLGFQWLLDPDGDPLTDDAPHIVNNSWSFTTTNCNLIFQPDLLALRSAGILPVFSAGNFGPESNTSVSPANYPEAFAVGAVNNDDIILSLSSRGPSTCGQDNTVYPDVTAPGSGVFTTDLFGMYVSTTGSSISAPHVSGAFALLRSAFPTAGIEVLEDTLRNTAADLGDPGADNVYGYGRIDVWAAYQSLLNSGQHPTATPTPTLTATPVPTPTQTPSPTPTPIIFDLIFPLFFGGH